MSLRLWPLRRGCQRCGTPARLTYHGWCPGCVRRCCDEGDGLRVGLPTPVDVHHAIGQLDAHLRIDGYRPRRCWTCALLLDYCTECDTTVTAMTADDLSVHGLVSNRDGGWVVIGCEGYVTAGLRSAATQART
ncbi:hypothetical protein GCM10027436_42580 [Actinophytocola sediminis]